MDYILREIVKNTDDIGFNDDLLRAADYIVELEQRLAAAEAKIPKWVPIRKGITYPSNDIRILVITKNSEVLTAHVTKEVIVPDDWFQGPVTHWMPIPEPPESEEKR